MSSYATTELVAVRVNEDPEFSAIEDADAESVTKGTLSSSVIEIVICCVPFSNMPPDTVLISITALLLLS